MPGPVRFYGLLLLLCQFAAMFWLFRKLVFFVLLRWLNMTLVCMFFLGGSAHARCGLPEDVMLLVDNLYVASSQGRTPDVDLAARIQQDLRGINMRDVSSKLFSVGLAHRRARIEALLVEAQRVGALGLTNSPNLLRERLNSVERLHNAVCKLEEIKADELAKSNEISRSSGPSRTFEHFSTTARMAILLGLTSFLSGLVVLVRMLYLWIYALVSARKTCRIAAALEEGLDVVDGTVTLLGRKGCRFQPVNSGAYDRVAAMMDKSGIFLVVNGQRFLMTSGKTRGFFVSMYFKRPLKRGTREALLALSSITPRDAPRQKKGASAPVTKPQAAVTGRSAAGVALAKK